MHGSPGNLPWIPCDRQGTLWDPLRYDAIISHISVSVSYRPISIDCPESCRVLTFLRDVPENSCPLGYDTTVAETLVPDVSKRREPFTERHSITSHKTIPLIDLFPSHPRYRYSPSSKQSVKMHTAAPVLLWIQIGIAIPLVKLQLLSGTEEF